MSTMPLTLLLSANVGNFTFRNIRLLFVSVSKLWSYLYKGENNDSSKTSGACRDSLRGDGERPDDQQYFGGKLGSDCGSGLYCGWLWVQSCGRDHSSYKSASSDNARRRKPECH